MDIMVTMAITAVMATLVGKDILVFNDFDRCDGYNFSSSFRRCVEC